MTSVFDQARAALDAEWAGWMDEAQAPPRVEVYDKDCEFVCHADLLISGQVTWEYNDAGEATLEFHGSSQAARWMVDELPDIADVHFLIQQGANRWFGKGATIEESMGKDGVETVTVEALHDFQHAKKIYCYPNPWLPVQVQWPKNFIFYGPAALTVKTLILINNMRRFQPGWIAAPDMFSARSYGTLDIDRWAQVVNPRGANLWTDTSEHTILVTRMGQLHEVLKPVLDDAGLMLTADRWLPGDPQPFPEHVTLSKPTLIWDVHDRSGVRGPTGSLLDGFVKLVKSVASDGVTETTEAVPYEVPQEYSRRDFWGTVNDLPCVVFYQNQRWTNVEGSGSVGVTSWSRVVHKALASAIITGGKSPGWINSSLKMFANMLLSWISMVFLSPGALVGVLDDEIEDVVFAFADWRLTGREKEMGRDAYAAYWEGTGQTGLNVSTLAAIRAGVQATRAYSSYSFEFCNGAPYIVGRHVDVGDRASAEIGRTGKIYTDRIEKKTLKWDAGAVRWTFDIGEGADKNKNPLARLGRLLETTKQIVQMTGVQS